MTRKPKDYVAAAYAPNGVLWWELETHPGTSRRFGGVRKIAAWLAFNVDEDGTFTMRDLRGATGVPSGTSNDAEHLNRRLRELRPDGWIVDSQRDDPTLRPDTYRLRKVGWHPALGERPRTARRVPSDLRRKVLERDGRRCVVCFVGGGEPYPGEPGTSAVLTAGHRVPAQRGTRVHSLGELQTECQRCNETVRDELLDPPTLAEVLPEVRRLPRADRDVLLRWLVSGHRLRSRLDEVYDRIRILSPPEREAATDAVRRSVTGGGRS